MSLTKSLLIATVAIGLSACSSFDGNNEVETLNKAAASGSAFTQQLTSEYRAFSNYELNTEKDFADALHFSRKGLSAAEGVNVMPEPVNDWDLTANDIVELSTAYNRLVAAIDKGARQTLPGKTAIAQARYDCWVEDQEEVAAGTPSDVNCKADFLALMTEIESALPATAAQAPEMAEEFPAPVSNLDNNEPLNLSEAMYLVFFDFDQSSINEGGQSVIDTVVNEITTRQINGISIVGHTDTSGSTEYNDKLAMKRATAIKNALIESGVPAQSISIEGRGESELLVQTQDGIREPANRRGVITFK